MSKCWTAAKGPTNPLSQVVENFENFLPASRGELRGGLNAQELKYEKLQSTVNALLDAVNALTPVSLCIVRQDMNQVGPDATNSKFACR